MVYETTESTAVPAWAAARIGWGVLGVGLLVWTMFEAVKHTGPTVPLAVLGLVLPWSAGLVRGVPAVRRILLSVRVPLAVMVLCSLVPGPAENTAAPFTFGMAWLAHLALRRAADHDPR
ncbi:hypothetical protein ABT093_03310 [Kitasatospora sp. NPDC002551]|uniref:hypothetical protein n=1 Tax=Kitasatospora sp. NPDC002551 TaxID=3154539 RepID=UPI00332E6C7D